jgi:DNA-binding SARP family transcriptional activator/Tfp pilus assembly protein PilF
MQKTVVRAERAKVVRLEQSKVSEIGLRRRSDRPILRIHLLGVMRGTTYLGDDILPRGKKARAILGCLCLAEGLSIPRARLASMLWDRVPDDQARTSFRQALRQMLRAMGPLASELIVADRDNIRLNVNLCWIDAVAVLTSEPSDFNALRSDLAALCTGELLEGLDGVSASFDQWLLGERTRFSERLRILHESELHQLDSSTVDAKQRASIARRLISFDPTHEGASRVLMRALADMGERAQALREFARCREALIRTLDVEPSPETRALYEAVRSFSGREGPSKAPVESHHSRLDATVEATPSTRGRLRVGVLPFLASGSDNQENLAFSLSQEIAAALARFRWFDVIAPVSLARRHSSAIVSETQLKRRELDYVVEGALSGNGEKFQISVGLLDLAQYATPVWRHRFDLAIGQLHQLDELVTARIVGQIDPVILYIEGQPRRREHYGATGLLLLAIPLMYSMEREKYEEAGQLINRALQIDPENAMVSAWAAHWQVYYVGQGWAADGARAFAIAQAHALKAMKLDPDNAEALGIYAHICSFLNKDFDNALHYFDRALRLNPNLAFVWSLSALTYSYVGEPDAALQRLERYRDLTPFEPYPSVFENPYTIAYTIKGEYEKAVNVGRRVVTATPDFVNAYKPLIASLGHLGRHDEARPYVEKLLSLEAGFTVERFGKVYPFKKPEDRERYMLGLRLGGIPES